MAAAPPDTTTEDAEMTEAQEFRDRFEEFVHRHGRDGWLHALETLLEISDVVYANDRCAQHALARIRDILTDAVPLLSEEES